MKKILKKTISGISGLMGLDFLIDTSHQGLILPFYHTVSDRDLPHIKHLYALTPVIRFKEDLDFFMKHYSPVSYNYLQNCIVNDNLRNKKTFFLSFDDGLREFHDVVAPVLFQKGIPATVFINSDYVDNKNMFYRLKISLLIERILKKELSTEEKKVIGNIFSQNGMKFNSAKDLLHISNAQKDMANKIAEVLEVDFSEYLCVNQPYLTTLQIENLIQKGFTIGAHSASHPFYPDLNEDMQINETIKCINFITEHFKTKNRLFSFPYTDFNIQKSFFDKINKNVDLTFGTANLKLDSVKTNFQRIPMERYGSVSAEEIVKQEYLFFILKMMISKQIIKRI